MSHIQPAGMVAENGVILSIGVQGLTQTMMVVNPMGTDSTVMDGSNRCKDAVEQFVNLVLPAFCDCFSLQSYVAFVEATGMTNGSVPYRKAFAGTDFPGTRAGDSIPTSIAGLGVWYQDPADVVGTDKIRVAKTFFPCLTNDDVIEDIVSTDLQHNFQVYLQQLLEGYLSDVDGAHSWYRVNGTPKPATAGAVLQRNVLAEARGYVYTQKRRLLPRF